MKFYKISYMMSLHNYWHSSVDIEAYSIGEACQVFRSIYGDWTKFEITDVAET